MIHNKHFMYSALKLLIGVLLILIAIPENKLVAQDWHLVESGVTSNLYDIQFVDKNTGWAVGETGTIIKTTDGGHTWLNQISNTDAELRSVYFIDSSRGWICGAAGAVGRTTDGGDEWEFITIDNSYYLEDVFFLDNSNGWIASANLYRANGCILKSTDAGLSWETKLETPLDLSYNHSAPDSVYKGMFRTIRFFNDRTGIACGEIQNDRLPLGSIIRSDDGGDTWKHLVDWNRWGGIRAAAILSPDTMYVGLFDSMAHTFDEWSSYVFHEPSFGSFDISVPDKSHTYLLGSWNLEMYVYHYKDDAIAAEVQNLEGPSVKSPNYPGQNAYFMGIFMLDSLTGWVCGDSGKLWRRPGFVNGIENQNVSEIVGINILEVYPNPAYKSGNFTKINVNLQSDRTCEAHIAVVNVLGATVVERIVRIEEGASILPMDVSLPRSGMYFLQVQEISTSGKIRNVVHSSPIIVYE